VDSQQLALLRQQLLEEKRELEQRLDENERYGLEDPRQETELSSYDNHPADGGSETYERGKDLSLRELSSFQLRQIDRALERMAQGTYGQCERCGKPIAEERLEVMPAAATCIECQKQIDARDGEMNRPVEESFLHPPFGRLNFDDNDTETEFDAEDAWQSVAFYGTSESPSDLNGELDYNKMYINSDEHIGIVEAIEGYVIQDMDDWQSEDWYEEGAYEIALNEPPVDQTDDTDLRF
jgi:YteA family regulatory protein